MSTRLSGIRACLSPGNVLNEFVDMARAVQIGLTNVANVLSE